MLHAILDHKICPRLKAFLHYNKHIYHVFKLTVHARIGMLSFIGRTRVTQRGNKSIAYSRASFVYEARREHVPVERRLNDPAVATEL
jgi:hypothetical protein